MTTKSNRDFLRAHMYVCVIIALSLQRITKGVSPKNIESVL